MDGNTDASISQEETGMPTLNRVDDAQKAISPSSRDASHARSSDSESSSSKPDKKGSPVGSRKRKAQDGRAPRSRLKRLRGFYNDDYRNLLNDTLGEIGKNTASGELKPLRGSQIGITVWSRNEKEIFFSALATKGRGDISGISAIVGSKTELEVHVYLQLLRKATMEHHLYDRHRQLLCQSDIAGAFEVSKDCCDVLDLAADALGVLQEKKEQVLEIEKYGELGLLNAGSTQWVEDHLHDGEYDQSEGPRVSSAAEILNLKSHLTLSARLFMNSTDPEYNWRSYSDRAESPSILHTAFADIQNIAISVTRRLVQSSLFFAMSRLRATGSSNYMHRQHVRRRDVTAALSVLGMKQDAESYWAGVAKRCKLDVYENLKPKTAKGEKLSYKEVEKRLGQPHKHKTKSDITTSQENDLSSPGSSHRNDLSMSDYPSEGITDITASPYDSDLSHRSRENYTSTQNRIEKDQDAYAEALDLQASHDEEIRLWKMLGQEPPKIHKPEETELPKNPGAERRSKVDLDDWRSWVDYVGQWDAHDTPVSASEFAANQRIAGNGGPFSASVQQEWRPRLAGGSDDDDDGSSEDEVMLEDGNGSGLSGDAHDILPTANLEEHYDERVAELKDRSNGADESGDSIDKDENEEADEDQDEFDSDLDSEPVSEAEDQDGVTSNTREQENLNASDDGVSCDGESGVDSSTDE